MAARAAPDGLAGDMDGSGDDSASGDPDFDLLTGAEKRSIAKGAAQEGREGLNTEGDAQLPGAADDAGK